MPELENRHQSRRALAVSSVPLSMRKNSGAEPRWPTMASSTSTVASEVMERRDVDGQGLLGELVGDVEQLEGLEVGGLVELVVDGPDVVGVGGPQPGAVSDRGSRPGSASWPSSGPEVPRHGTDAGCACGSRSSPPGAGSSSCGDSHSGGGPGPGHGAGLGGALLQCPGPGRPGAGWNGVGRWPDTPDARRHAKLSTSITTAWRRRAGLRSFPRPPLSAWRCRAPGRPRCA